MKHLRKSLKKNYKCVEFQIFILKCTFFFLNHSVQVSEQLSCCWLDFGLNHLTGGAAMFLFFAESIKMHKAGKVLGNV